MEEFQGLVAAETGGASGIGAATAALLASRGATVAVLDRVAPPAGHPFFEVDPTDDAHIADAVAGLEQKHGRLDVLINNAGIGAQGDVTANDRAEWHRVLDANVVGTARATAAALPLLRRSPHAAVVNVSSVVALVASATERSTPPPREPFTPSRSRWPPTTSRRASASTASCPAPRTPHG